MSTVFTTIRTDLHNRFGHAVDTATIDALLDETYQRHMRTAVVNEFVPILVERDVTEQLDQMGATKRKRVIFVSRADRTLADAAVALTHSMSMSVEASAAPTHPENLGNPTLELAFSQRDMDLSHRARGFRAERVLEAADIVVYMTPDEVQDVPALREVVWDFSGADSMTISQAGELADDLEARVMAMLNTIAPRTVGPALAY